MAGEERGLAGRGSPIVGSETAACEELGSVCSVQWQSSSVCRCADGDGGREGAVWDWLWSEMESWVGFWVFTSVGKVGGSGLCRSHLHRLPDPHRVAETIFSQGGGGGEEGVRVRARK